MNDNVLYHTTNLDGLPVTGVRRQPKYRNRSQAQNHRCGERQRSKALLRSPKMPRNL